MKIKKKSDICKEYIYVPKDILKTTLKKDLDIWTKRGLIEKIEARNGIIFKVKIKPTDPNFDKVFTFVKTTTGVKIINNRTLQTKINDMSLVKQAFKKFGGGEKLQVFNIKINDKDFSLSFLTGETFAKFIEMNSGVDNPDKTILLNKYSSSIWNLFFSITKLLENPDNLENQTNFKAARESLISAVNEAETKWKYNRANLPGIIGKTIAYSEAEGSLFTATTSFEGLWEGLSPAERNNLLKQRGIFQKLNIEGINDYRDVLELATKERKDTITKLKLNLENSLLEDKLHGTLVMRPMPGEGRFEMVNVNIGGKEKAIKMHSFLAFMMVKDFDGDQAELVLPLSNKMQPEVKNLYKSMLKNRSNIFVKSVHEMGSTVYKVSTLYSKLAKGKSSITGSDLNNMFGNILKTMGTGETNPIARDVLKNFLFKGEILKKLGVSESDIFEYKGKQLVISKVFKDAVLKNQDTIRPILKNNIEKFLLQSKASFYYSGIPIDVGALPKKLQEQFGGELFPSVNYTDFFRIYGNMAEIMDKGSKIPNLYATISDIFNRPEKILGESWNDNTVKNIIEANEKIFGKIGKKLVGGTAYASETTILGLGIAKDVGEKVHNELFKNLPAGWLYKIQKDYSALNEIMGASLEKHAPEPEAFFGRYKKLLSKKLNLKELEQTKLFKKLGLTEKGTSELFGKHATFAQEVLGRIADIQHFDSSRPSRLFTTFKDRDITEGMAIKIGAAFIETIASSESQTRGSDAATNIEESLKFIYNIYRNPDQEAAVGYFKDFTGVNIGKKSVERAREIMAGAKKEAWLFHIFNKVTSNKIAGTPGLEDITEQMLRSDMFEVLEEEGFRKAELENIKKLITTGKIEEGLAKVEEIRIGIQKSSFNPFAFFGQKSMEKMLASKEVPKAATSLKSLLPYIAAGAIGLVAIGNLMGPNGETNRRIRSHMDLTRSQWSSFKKSRRINMGDKTVFGKDKPYRQKKIYNVDINYQGGRLYV